MSLRLLRISCWSIAFAFGALQAWTTRFQINPDGISYLDVGDAYWHGDWHNAISAYWSPLYSWILGAFINVIRPSMYWEYPLVHLVNLLTYIAALFCFDFFLKTFIDYRKSRDRQLHAQGQVGLSESSCWWFGYSLFVATSLLLISVGQSTPDMLVAGFFYFASALILRIQVMSPSSRTFIALGATLAVAYLAKAVMFPVAFVFLAAAFAASRDFPRRWLNLGMAAGFFFLVASPFIVAVSVQQKHLTFGESGVWNYAFYVNHVPYFATEVPGLKHPLRTISKVPPVYEFGGPVAGTFPPWYDPAYWHAGIKPHFDFESEINQIADASIQYEHEFFVLFLNVTVGLCILFFTGDSVTRSVARAAQCWAIALPAVATLALYSLVHLETRFVGAPVTLLFMVACSGVSFPRHPERMRAAAYTIILVAISLIVMVAFGALVERHKMFGPVYSVAASALQQDGVGADSRLGLIWNETWNDRAVVGAFVPRLLRAKVVVEETNADSFWKLDAEARNDTVAKIRAAGAQAIIAYQIPSQMQAGWRNLGGTGYFAYIFPTTGAVLHPKRLSGRH